MPFPTVITLQTTQFLKYMIRLQKVLFDSAHCVPCRRGRWRSNQLPMRAQNRLHPTQLPELRS